MRASERAHTRCVFAEALVCDEGGGVGVLKCIDAWVAISG